MTAQEKKYWIGFSCFTPIGPKSFKKLLNYYGTTMKAWAAPGKELVNIGFKPELVARFTKFREKLDLPSYFLRLKKLGVNSITLEDKNYPENLKCLKDAPFLLYILGEILPSDQLAIGVVGTRKITSYGKQVTESLTADLVSSGLTIVSGLAYGVDYLAHTTALEFGGRTLGVWAGGLDTLTDGFRKSLVEKIISSKQGAIISEYPLGFHPTRSTFPLRNRIIAGLSLGVLVTEAASDSGALITAEYCCKQGRKVFAVPGPITSPMTAGTAKLLKSKAILVYEVKDILDELRVRDRVRVSDARQVLPEDQDEKKILEILKNENRNIDELSRKTGINIGELVGLLTMMEIRGKIKNLGGSVYKITR